MPLRRQKANVLKGLGTLMKATGDAPTLSGSPTPCRPEKRGRGTSGGEGERHHGTYSLSMCRGKKGRRIEAPSDFAIVGGVP